MVSRNTHCAPCCTQSRASQPGSAQPVRSRNIGGRLTCSTDLVQRGVHAQVVRAAWVQVIRMHNDSPACGGYSERPDAGHHVAHNLVGPEELHQPASASARHRSCVNSVVTQAAVRLPRACVPLVLVLQPRVPVNLSIVQAEDGAVLAHLRLRDTCKRASSHVSSSAQPYAGLQPRARGAAAACGQLRRALRASAHLQARVAGDDFKLRHAELAVDRANLRPAPAVSPAASRSGARTRALFSTVLMRGVFLSSSTRPMTSLKGSSSSRRLRCATCPTVSNEPGTSEPGGSSVCAAEAPA